MDSFYLWGQGMARQTADTLHADGYELVELRLGGLAKIGKFGMQLLECQTLEEAQTLLAKAATSKSKVTESQPTT